MMARKPSMADALVPPKAAPAVTADVPPPEARPQADRASGRAGKKGIAFWVDPAASKQLAMIGVEEDRTVQSLMEEALDLLFQSRGKHRLAAGGRRTAA